MEELKIRLDQVGKDAYRVWAAGPREGEERVLVECPDREEAYNAFFSCATAALHAAVGAGVMFEE